MLYCKGQTLKNKDNYIISLKNKYFNVTTLKKMLYCKGQTLTTYNILYSDNSYQYKRAKNDTYFRPLYDIRMTYIFSNIGVF